jgi:hypothetical protein
MGSMLGLMELGSKLATVQPLEEKPSVFNEKAFRNVRKNFQRLVYFFNELADVTGQDHLRAQSDPSPATSIVLSIESENNRL